MSQLYRTLVRPLLFSQDSETIHDRILHALSWTGHHKLFLAALSRLYAAPSLPTRVFGLDFPNPLGLGAGMDKMGLALPTWAAFGFGFCELGGVTWHPQSGNDKPRMFRAIPHQGLVNRMGFNNPGAEELARTLALWRNAGLWPAHPVGINLGKSKITPLTEAAREYARSFKTLWACADFFVVNVSSPNTPNLRQLQDKASLNDILVAMQEVNASMASAASTPGARAALKPILVKVAPDLDPTALDEILELVEPCRVAGVVATNTTVSRPDTSVLKLRKIYAESGGLSGKPLCARSTEIVRHLFRQSAGKIPIIGVGGVFSAADAWEKIVAGASLVQVYTGFVYEGPALPGEIVKGLRKRLADHGLDRLEQAVGLENRAGER